jgi:hypothetical protein
MEKQARMAAWKKKPRHEQVFLRLFLFTFAAHNSLTRKFCQFFRKNAMPQGAERQKISCGKTVHVV